MNSTKPMTSVKGILLAGMAVAVLAGCSSTRGDDMAKTGMRKDGSGKHMSNTHGSMHKDKMKAYQGAGGVSSDDLMAGMDTDRVFFAFDSSSLDGRAQTVLKAIAADLQENSGEYGHIMVEGHCDERGTREYNLALGDRRAVAVKKYLVGLGVPSNRIMTVSYGKERPVDRAHNSDAWAKNRRAVVDLK